MAVLTDVYPQVENRGWPTTPFGFVYTSDNVRLVFSDLDGVSCIWAGNWDDPEPEDYAAAWRALVKAGVQGYEDATTMVIANGYDDEGEREFLRIKLPAFIHA